MMLTLISSNIDPQTDSARRSQLATYPAQNIRSTSSGDLLPPMGRISIVKPADHGVQRSSIAAQRSICGVSVTIDTTDAMR